MPENYQDNMFVQNISPYYMNNTSNLIGAAKASPSTSGGFLIGIPIVAQR